MIPATSSEWPGTKAWIEGRIAEAQRHLENPNLDPVATAVERGKIAALRNIVATVEPTQTEGDESPDYYR